MGTQTLKQFPLDYQLGGTGCPIRMCQRWLLRIMNGSYCCLGVTLAVHFNLTQPWNVVFLRGSHFPWFRYVYDVRKFNIKLAVDILPIPFWKICEALVIVGSHQGVASLAKNNDGLVAADNSVFYGLSNLLISLC